MFTRLCEICREDSAVIQCDNLLWLCKNCAISAGYDYQVYDLPDKPDEDEEEEEDDEESEDSDEYESETQPW